jgi:hypothetical protein
LSVDSTLVSTLPRYRRHTTLAIILLNSGRFHYLRVYGFLTAIKIASSVKIPAVAPTAMIPGLRQTTTPAVTILSTDEKR